MVELQYCPAREQSPLAEPPYDYWVTPAGDVRAEFYRISQGYLLRFPGETDFEIFPDLGIVRRWPISECDPDHLDSLYRNAVLPILGNHGGGLFLHGSAVVIDGAAVAFLGLSRSGKTTLAAALAKQGHPLLTEDVIELTALPTGFALHPKASALRLFSDSAAYLLGQDPSAPGWAFKQSIPASAGIAVHEEAVPLARIYFLGQDQDAALAIRQTGPADALREMLKHSFILDVEDRNRLNAHFCRIAGLSEKIPCFTLDYPRRYSELARVLEAVIDASRQDGGYYAD